MSGGVEWARDQEEQKKIAADYVKKASVLKDVLTYTAANTTVKLPETPTFFPVNEVDIITHTGEVTNPKHYQAQGGKQLWDVMQDLVPREQYIGYLKLNITKYLHRYRDKGGKQSLEKAKAYLDKLIQVEYGTQTKEEK
jgi:hypothetical protein